MIIVDYAVIPDINAVSKTAFDFDCLFLVLCANIE